MNKYYNVGDEIEFNGEKTKIIDIKKNGTIILEFEKDNVCSNCGKLHPKSKVYIYPVNIYVNEVKSVKIEFQTQMEK